MKRRDLSDKSSPVSNTMMSLRRLGRLQLFLYPLVRRGFAVDLRIDSWIFCYASHDQSSTWETRQRKAPTVPFRVALSFSQTPTSRRSRRKCRCGYRSSVLSLSWNNVF